MDEFRDILKGKGQLLEQVKQENIDLFSIYRREDELIVEMRKLKHHQYGFKKDQRRCLYQNEKVISHLYEGFDGLGHAVKNLDKHSRRLETQCSQMEETQSLILTQLDEDNAFFSNMIICPSPGFIGPQSHQTLYHFY